MIISLSSHSVWRPFGDKDTHDLVPYGVDVVGRVEGVQLVRQQVPGAEEDEPAHADEVVCVGVQHHRRHLPLLVA